MLISADGYMEVDLDESARSIVFGDKANKTRIKINNKPLRTCYQRTSDSPQYADERRPLPPARKRRDLDTRTPYTQRLHDFITADDMFQDQNNRKKREIIYNYDTFCDNVFNGAASSLAT